MIGPWRRGTSTQVGARRARSSNRRRPGLAASGLNWPSGIAQGPPRRTVLGLACGRGGLWLPGLRVPAPPPAKLPTAIASLAGLVGAHQTQKSCASRRRPAPSGAPGGQACCREVSQGTKPSFGDFKMCQSAAQFITIAVLSFFKFESSIWALECECFRCCGSARVLH